MLIHEKLFTFVPVILLALRHKNSLLPYFLRLSKTTVKRILPNAFQIIILGPKMYGRNSIIIGTYIPTTQIKINIFRENIFRFCNLSEFYSCTYFLCSFLQRLRHNQSRYVDSMSHI